MSPSVEPQAMLMKVLILVTPVEVMMMMEVTLSVSMELKSIMISSSQKLRKAKELFGILQAWLSKSLRSLTLKMQV